MVRLIIIKRILFIITLALSAIMAAQAAPHESTTWNFRRQMIPLLAKAVPRMLESQDPKTGRFGSGIWIAADQLPIYPLAVAWATKDPANRYYHDRKLLSAIMQGGDALVALQEKNGQWMFRKKDNSTWGNHFDPWVYSRWIRTFHLIRDGMPAKRRERWEKALTLGYSGIARSALTTPVNIPAHHAMGLYIAGQALNHPEWCDKAAGFLQRVAAAQDTNGFWTEHSGPVVGYNFVYVDALGIYYALSHDDKVRDALERATTFHANFVYANGSDIETIDERVPYSATGHIGGPGLTFTAIGRALLREQWERELEKTSSRTFDLLASMLLYGQEGPLAPLPAHNRHSVFVMADGKASVIREGPWCGVLSAYACPTVGSRWIQDRQNFLSLFHEKTGLILGGGNTKLQPLWSTFTVGDTQLLKHNPGDKNPNFSPRPGLLHVPSRAALNTNASLLTLRYGSTDCTAHLSFLETNKARVTYTASVSPGTPRVEGHATFIPAVEKTWRTASGKTGILKGPFDLSAEQTGDWFEHNGWRIQVPKGSHLTWPVLRHNPYRDDGRSDLNDARIVLTLPFSEKVSTQSVDIDVAP